MNGKYPDVPGKVTVTLYIHVWSETLQIGRSAISLVTEHVYNPTNAAFGREVGNAMERTVSKKSNWNFQ